jgi:hypothetical protein
VTLRLAANDDEAAKTLAKKIKWGTIAYKYARPLLPAGWKPSWL